MSKTYRFIVWAEGLAMNRTQGDPPLPLAVASASGLILHRRMPPTQPQFTGKVNVGDPALPGARVVQLRLRDGTVIAATRSDPTTGAFSFPGWYVASSDYEFHVVGDDKVSRSFPVTSPVVHRWRGDPTRFSSAGDGAPVVQPPEPLLFETHYPPILPNVAYDFTPTVRNGQGALTFSVQGSVPAGLTFNSSTGRLTGTTSVTGAYPVTVRATDTRGVTGEIVTDFDVGTTFKFWRLFITANNGDSNYTNVQEVELRGTVGGADLTVPGGPATASTFLDGSSAPSTAFDNTIGSAVCWTTAFSVPFPHWLAYEFPTRTRVVEIALWNRDGLPTRPPSAFQVQVSNRGSAWTTVSSHSSFGAWSNSTAKIFLTGL